MLFRSSDENETQYQNAEKALEDWIAEYQEEYESLDYIIDEVNGIDGSRYGETMINENYFHEYIKSDQEDIVDRIIDSNFPLSSYLSFDWDSYISDCQMNYMFIETKEDAYWVRG